VYASGVPGAPAGSGADGQDGVRVEATRLRDLGFRAVKVAIGVSPADDIASVHTVRDVFGPDAVVLADAAGQYELPQAVQVGRARRCAVPARAAVGVPVRAAGGRRGGRAAARPAAGARRGGRPGRRAPRAAPAPPPAPRPPAPPPPPPPPSRRAPPWTPLPGE